VDLSNGKSLQNNNLHNNKYHFLFSFLYWSLIQIQSRIASSCLVFSILAQHIQDLSPFLHSVRQEGRLSVARSVCGLVGQSDREAVRRGYGLSVVLWPCVPVCPWLSLTVPPYPPWPSTHGGPVVPVAPVPTVVPGVQWPSLVLGIRDPRAKSTQPCPTGSLRFEVRAGSGPQCCGSQPAPCWSSGGSALKINKNR